MLYPAENCDAAASHYDVDGFAWYPYDAMPDAVTSDVATGPTEKVFVGQLLYGFTAPDVARLTSYLSGTDVTEAMAVVMYKDDGRSAGCGFVYVPEYASAILRAFSRRVLCQRDGVWVAQDELTMDEWFTASCRGGRGAVVFESARPRSVHGTPAPEDPPVVWRHDPYTASRVVVHLPEPVPSAP